MSSANDETAVTSKRFDGAVGAIAGLLGALVTASGLLVVPSSLLGGAWGVAIGLCLLGAVLLGSTRGRDLLGLPPEGGDTAALALVGLAAVLAVAFVAVNYASFAPGESGSASG
jgi:hypothetical protein